MPQACRGNTKAGQPCKSMAVGDDGYCQHHSPSRRRGEAARGTDEQAPDEALMAEAHREMIKILGRGDVLPENHWPCGLATHSVLRRIVEQSTKDKETQKILLAEAEGFRRALVREYSLKTALERMIADRIVLSYARLLFMEAISDMDHETLVDTHGHLYAHRKATLRESTEFLRNVRALRDLKTVPLRVMIRDAGQVNVGQQQINVTDSEQVARARQTAREGSHGQHSETQALDSTQAQEDRE